MSGARFERLVEIMRALRGPDGCPWDRQQDLKSLQPMLIEEVYEVIEAVDNQDLDGLAEELGDLLLHVVFHSELGREAGAFTIDDVLEGICQKLVRRHPHVFGAKMVAGPGEALDTWEAIKKAEKDGGDGQAARSESVLDGIPPRLPALHEAHKISARVARRGFDWDTLEEVLEKLTEETEELRAAAAIHDGARRAEQVEAEIGDMLFVLVNVARHLGIDSETALKRSNRKFRTRFGHIETALEARGRELSDADRDELEALWQQAKSLESETDEG